MNRYSTFLLCCALLLLSQAHANPYTVQNEPHLQHARALVRAALDAVDFPAEFIDAPLGNERRNLYMISQGFTDLDMMPATPDRLRLWEEGRLRMIPVPLDRGLLGYRLNLLLASRQDILADVDTVEELAHFNMGQNVGWMDVEIYRSVGIPTKEVKLWSNGEFVEQMEAGFLDLFPLGLEETLSYFLPHFQQRYPQLAADPHLLVRYPWFRFVWVSPEPEADALYEALLQGFDLIAADDTFMSVWRQYRSPPADSFFSQRRIIDIGNPFYDETLVALRYRHLLYDPPVSGQ